MLATSLSIYLDYAAAAPLDYRVARLVNKISRNFWANPSSAHSAGQAAKSILEKARQKIALLLGVRSPEIIFTGSGTESDNLAVLGVARACRKYGRRLITSSLEHPAVKQAFKHLEAREGFSVVYLPVNRQGLVDPESLRRWLRSGTTLVSLQYANGEIGTVQPVREVAKIIREFRTDRFFKQPANTGTSIGFPFFHVDACQAAGSLNIRPSFLGADLLSFNGVKIHGPAGTGVLFKKEAVKIEPLVFGGGQEGKWRSGTPAVALVAGLALALEISEKTKNLRTKKLARKRDWLKEKILKKVPEACLLGHPRQRLPNHLSLTFKETPGERLVAALSRKGIMVSAGSACSFLRSEKLFEEKNELDNANKEMIRFSLDKATRWRDLKKTAAVVIREANRLRLAGK